MGPLRLLMAAVLVGAGAVGVAAEGAPQAELHGLGNLGGGDFESRAYAVSANGRVVVGYSKTPAGTEAFRWTPEEGMVGLGSLSPTDMESIARDVSADGRVVVGRTRYEGSAQNVYEAFRWTAAGGMEGLGFLPGGSRSEACGVSATGHGFAATR